MHPSTHGATTTHRGRKLLVPKSHIIHVHLTTVRTILECASVTPFIGGNTLDYWREKKTLVKKEIYV